MNLDIDRIDDGLGIQLTLQSHNAKWHSLCYKKFSKSKLTRTQERQDRKRNAQEFGTATPSPVKTRRKLDLTPVTKKKICLFCDENDDKELLHEATSKAINKTVVECARALGDSKILTRLACGDMKAIDAYYHLSCLTYICNRQRSHKTKIEN